MQLWQVIAAVLIFKAFDGCFAAAAMMDFKAPIATFAVALLLWFIVTAFVWFIAVEFDRNKKPAAKPAYEDL